jgi:hypothetical protein
LLPLATLITPNKSEAELILSHKHKGVPIPSLADFGLCIDGAAHPRFKSGLAKRRTRNNKNAEVYEALGMNLSISVYQYGLTAKNI